MEHVDTSGYARWFRDSTPYISQHRGKTFVVLLGGDALQDRNLVNVVHDLALAHVLGLSLVVVHGARPQIDEALPEATYCGDRRITQAAEMDTITGIFGQLRTRLESLFSTGLPTSPLRNTDIAVVSGNFVAARPLGVLDGVDHQLTGQVRRVHTDRMRRILDSRAIVLLSPIGYSSSGQAYNLVADELAADVALALKAEKLIVFDEVSTIVDTQGNPRPTLTPAELDEIADNTETSDATHARLRALLRAARGGVPRGVMISYAEDGALLQELFTAEGHGSQVSEDLTELVRPARPEDVASIVEVIRPLEEAGVLVRRSRDRLEQEIEHFLVAAIDANIVGCCAVYPVDESAELACMAVREGYRSSERRPGIAKGLLKAAERAARAAGAKQLFVLTTQTQDWFRDQGFEPADVADLPAPKQALYNYQRNSKVLIKPLKG